MKVRVVSGFARGMETKINEVLAEEKLIPEKIIQYLSDEFVVVTLWFNE